MPMSYRIDPESRVVQVIVEGTLSGGDLLAWTERMRSDPDFRPEYDQLVDLRTARGAEVETAAVRNLAQNEPLFSTSSRRAIVVDSDFGFGMVRMFQTMRGEEAGDIQVFRDYDEARTWLQSD